VAVDICYKFEKKEEKWKSVPNISMGLYGNVKEDLS